MVGRCGRQTTIPLDNVPDGELTDVNCQQLARGATVDHGYEDELMFVLLV